MQPWKDGCIFFNHITKGDIVEILVLTLAAFLAGAIFSLRLKSLAQLFNHNKYNMHITLDKDAYK